MKATCLAAATVLMLFISPERSWSADRSVHPQTSATQHGEVSAQRKKARRKGHVANSRSPYYLRPGVRPSFGYIGPPGYAGEYAWRKSIGQCVEDLGYGRWAACGHR